MKLHRAFAIFPLSGGLLAGLMMYPSEAALTNIILSLPVSFIHFWAALGIACCLLLRRSPWQMCASSVAILLPSLVLLYRLPTPV